MAKINWSDFGIVILGWWGAAIIQLLNEEENVDFSRCGLLAIDNCDRSTTTTIDRLKLRPDTARADWSVRYS